MSKFLFDIGANRGLYTDTNRKLYGRSILVEPNSTLVKGLHEKYKDEVGIEIVEAIVSKNPSEIFYISNEDTISTVDLEWIQASRFTPNYRWTPVEGIPTVSLDTLIAQYGVPDLIKIDVGGYEYNVLQSLTQKVPLLAFQWAEEKKIEILQSLDYLDKLGFKEFQIQMEDKFTFFPKDDRWLKYTEFYKFLELLLFPENKDKWGMIWARIPHTQKKFLYVDSYNHHKNRIGFHKMCEAGNISLTVSKTLRDENDWDLVFIPCDFIPANHFPKAKAIMYGPHNFVFVNGVWKRDYGYEFPPHCFYNLLSDWVIELQKEVGELALPSKAIPFAVDTELFKPKDLPKEYDCLIYFKNRHSSELEYVVKELQKQNLSYTILKYGSYKEDEYLQLLHTSRFGIWIGTHESQGFALEEALSCNVPLLVWDSTSMFQEYSNNEQYYKDKVGKYSLKSTTIPYWDSQCGLSFTEKEDMPKCLESMRENYNSFKPREYILRTVSPKVCIERLLKELETLK